MRPDPDREALRRMLLDRRDSTSSDMLEMTSQRIRERLLRMGPFREAGSVGAYHAIGSEVRTAGIIQDILDAGQQLLLPAVSGDSLVFRAVQDAGDLVRGRFGIMEPKTRCEAGIPEVLLVPAVGVTVKGTRLGYGSGYYDRYLRLSGAVSVAVTLEKQIVGKIPEGSGDVPVDWVVTENRLLHV